MDGKRARFVCYAQRKVTDPLEFKENRAMTSLHHEFMSAWLAIIIPSKFVHLIFGQQACVHIEMRMRARGAGATHTKT